MSTLTDVDGTNYTYFYTYNTYTGEGSGGVKKMTTFKDSFLSGDPWFIHATFKVTSITDGRWKPIVGSMYISTSNVSNWGLWINPSQYIHWRNSNTVVNTTLKVDTKDIFYHVLVNYTGSTIRFALRNTSTGAIQDASDSTSGLYTSIPTGNLVTSGGWVNNSSEGFPGTIETVRIGKYSTLSLISDIITSPLERGSTLSFLTSGIGYYFSSIRGAGRVSSNNLSIATITSTGGEAFILNAISPGVCTISCTIDDGSTFYPSITTTVSVTISKTTATLSVSKPTVVVKYVLNSTVSFDYITSNNTEGPTRTHTSGSTSVVTIPNSSVATAQIVGVGSSQINTVQSTTTNYTQQSGNTVLIVVVGQGGSYSSVSMASLDLSGTDLSSTVFTSCDLTGANLFSAVVNSTTDLRTSTLTSIKSGRIRGITTFLPVNYKLI